MVNTNQIAEIAALVGDPARAAMLTELLDDRALTAGELSRVAGVTPQTASSHLARLASSGLLKVEKQGRHRYHRLATPKVARMLEGIMQIAAEREPARRRLIVGPRDEAMRRARTCYDHLAGRIGVAIADALIVKGVIEFGEEAGLVTDQGTELLRDMGIAFPDGSANKIRSSRPLCRPCLDWSERRPHLAGKLGAAICAHSFEAGWVRRKNGSRALDVTPKGQAALRQVFGISSTEERIY